MNRCSLTLSSIVLAVGCTVGIGTAGVGGSMVAAPSAAGAGQAEAPLARPFELKAAGTVRIAGASLTVEFEKVAEDSRCPEGVTCVWEGDAVARLHLLGSGLERATLNLHTQSSFPREGTFQKYRVRLVGLAPSRRSGSEIPPDAYVATLVVSVTE
jgi:hypothetical protein